jgi:hypothetical protein
LPRTLNSATRAAHSQGQDLRGTTGRSASKNTFPRDIPTRYSVWSAQITEATSSRGSRGKTGVEASVICADYVSAYYRTADDTPPRPSRNIRLDAREHAPARRGAAPFRRAARIRARDSKIGFMGARLENTNPLMDFYTAHRAYKY